MNKKIIAVGLTLSIICVASISYFIMRDIESPFLQNDAVVKTEEGIDTDGNGLYEYIKANISINVSESGNYSILSSLLPINSTQDSNDAIHFTDTIATGYLQPDDPDADWYFYTFFGKTKYLNIGENKITLYYSGNYIYNSQIDGPYKISLTIYSFNASNTLDSEQVTTCSFVTKDYNYTQFQGDLIKYINATEYTEDTDNDGLFDYLTLELTVETRIDGNYSFHCTLFGGINSPLSQSLILYLTKGIHKVPIRINGYEIYQNRINTSFNASISLNNIIWNSSHQDYTTLKYHYLDFETPKAYFTGIITDYGLDENGNGLFDNLIMEVQLQIMESGNYSLSSALEDSNGRFITNTQNHTYFEKGIRSMYLEFNGSYFYNHGVNGSYYLNRLRLYDDNGTTFDSFKFMNISFSTSEYNYQDFDPPTTNPPEKPTYITGPSEGIQRIEYTFNTSTVEIDGDMVCYAWDWDGDEIIDEWTGFYNSGETCSIVHDWWDPGTYIVRVKAADSFNIKSDWSEPLTIVILPED